MARYIGHIDESVEQWSSYTERFEYFVDANGIETEKTVSTFLSLMGAKTFALHRSLVQPAKPGEKSFADIVKHCEFGYVLSDTIRDRLVCGLRSEAIQKRLLSESNLTLQKATEFSVSMELAAKEAQPLSNTSKMHKLAMG
uniref:Uncharacterized protein n=1 Tax=Pygocentrus nattereri TaxID=42514 RepID=A0AAR2KSV2_PYGNA